MNSNERETMKKETRGRKPYPKTSGEIVRALRLAQGLTQAQLAKLCGQEYNQGSITQIELGVCEIGKKRAVILGKVLGVHPAQIMFPDLYVEHLRENHEARKTTLALNDLEHKMVQMTHKEMPTWSNLWNIFTPEQN
jgi:transcriptional regulator with XRE-family HTH domain